MIGWEAGYRVTNPVLDMAGLRYLLVPTWCYRVSSWVCEIGAQDGDAGLRTVSRGNHESTDVGGKRAQDGMGK